MASSALERAKALINELTDDDRQALARYLQDLTAPASEQPINTPPPPAAPQPNIVWLKKHREAYAGKFVALIDGRLVGSGRSQRKAREQAAQQGVRSPLILRVTAINEALPGDL